MSDLIILVGCIVLGIAFFGKRGKGHDLVIQFPTKANQKGVRTRTNGFIILGLMVFALLYMSWRRQGVSFHFADAVLFIGTAFIVYILVRKETR